MNRRHPREVILALAILLFQAGVFAQSGFSPERLARVDRLLQQYVDDNRIAGIVALVLCDGRPVYEKAVGWSNKEAGRRMTTDTIFRIASQTKAITSAAVMVLVEEGKVALGDPVSRYLPSFARTTVAVKVDTGVTIVPAKRAITIRDLLTHTSGISYGTDLHVAASYEAKGLGPAASRWGFYIADRTERICDLMEQIGGLPAVSQPGEAFVYGYSTDILGCVVERASGMPLDTFVRTRITDPLEMKDTHFFLPADQGNRLAVVYTGEMDERITRAGDGPNGQGSYGDGPRRAFSGGAGLLSTARDYSRFLDMIRNGGELDGVRILAPRTVALMTTDHVGTLWARARGNANAGVGFGFGFSTTERYGANGMESPGSFGWAGAYGSVYRVDPEARLVMVLMIQLLPNTTDIHEKFSTLVYQALLDSSANTDGAAIFRGLTRRGEGR